MSRDNEILHHDKQLLNSQNITCAILVASHVPIRKTFPCNEYPLKPHVYTEKTGICGGLPNFLIIDPKHILWVLVTAEAVLTCTHSVCFERK